MVSEKGRLHKTVYKRFFETCQGMPPPKAAFPAPGKQYFSSLLERVGFASDEEEDRGVAEFMLLSDPRLDLPSA